MGHVSRSISRVGGRRVVLALGGLYVAVAVGLPIVQVGGDLALGDLVIDSLLLGTSGLALTYGGYRLPRTNIRADLFPVVAGWCLRALGVMLAIVFVGAFAGTLNDPVAGFFVLPSLASVAGLGMGYHDARARTRALDAEERRREAERYSQELERYQTIVETVNDGIFVLDEESRFTLVNDAYTELVGYDREDLIGSHSSVVAAEETDVDAMSDEIRRDLTAGTAVTKSYESTVKTASGRKIDVESTIAPLPEQEDARHDKVVVVRDVTERNERERRLEQQNERLDSFAGMLAHELRNPVTIGQIYSQQLPAEANPEAVEYVTEAFDRIENMIDVMLVVTRGREAISGNAPVELAAVARDAWDEVDAADATLRVELDDTIRADQTYVRHLFRNLFENAVEHGSTSNQSSTDDAVEHGSASSRAKAHTDADEHGSASERSSADDVHQTSSDAVHRSPKESEDAGSGVTVTVGELPTGFYVADDGTGIPAADRETIFETGYTTASSRGGMGLGLTFVHEMADVYGWRYSVTESESGGARFEFENVTEPRNVTD